MFGSKASDSAGVIAPPPLIALAAMVVGLILDHWLPIGAVEALAPRAFRLALGAILLIVAGIVAGRAIRGFRAARTHVEPWKPATALVTSGVYAKTRNPMYEALGFVVLAVALAAASDWTLVCGVIAAIVLHYGVVMREETYLLAKFGDRYRAYLASVPRYGWPF